MPSRWLVEENRRTALAMLAATVVGVVATGVLRYGLDAGVLRSAVASLLSGWAAFCLMHFLLCRRAYGDAAGAALRDRLLADPARTPRRSRWAWLVSGDGHSFAVTASAMSLIGVVILVLYPDLRSDALLLIIGVALVAATWLDMAMAYAVEYALLDLTEGGMEWPGEQDQRFTDYEYFAYGVQSTLGVTDVAVGTARLRVTVRRHGVLAFAFNSVIVALLVSLVLTLG